MVKVKMMARRKTQKPKSKASKKKVTMEEVIARKIDTNRDIHINAIAALLNDPCNAPLPPPFLPGEQGMITRFVFDGALIGAGNGSGYLVFHPNSGWAVSNNAATGSTAIPASDFSISATNSPGFNFLAANATKVRGLAACVTVLPAALSITAITGDICVSSVSPSAVRQIISASHTVDSLASYTNARTAIERRAYDTKFKPGNLDSKYSSYQNTGTIVGTGTDIDDTSAILVVIRGVPTGSPINIRITWICEWVPKFNLGLSASVTNKPMAVDHMAVGAMLDRKKPNWWNNLLHEAGEAVGYGVRNLSRSASMYMQSAATNFLAGGLGALALV